MKTNFLCRNALPRGAGVFLKFGLSLMALMLFCLSGYAQGELQQHVYLKFHKNDAGVPDQIKVEPLSYSYHGRVDDETATLRLSENSNENGFHAQLTLMENIPNLFVRFGVSVGEFNRIYSLNNSKLFYDKGNVTVDQYGEIDIYYDGTRYQVTYDGMPVECEEPSNLSGLRKAFISTYGRPNTGGEVNFMLEPYSQGIIADCTLGCECDCDSPTPDLVCCERDATPELDISRVTCSAVVQAKEREVGKLQGYITTYPNPVNNQLTLNINSVIDDDIVIQIIDVTGRTVHVHSASVIAKSDNTFHLDVSNLSGGIYYMNIDAKYRFETKKITIIK